MRRKVAFPLSRVTNEFPPFDIEFINVEELRAGIGRVEEIPLFVPSLSVGDVIRYRNESADARYVATLSHSGHSTFRVVLYDDDFSRRVENDLPAMGCVLRLADFGGYYAIDLPPRKNMADLRAYLIAAAEAGKLDYEEACISFEHSREQ